MKNRFKYIEYNLATLKRLLSSEYSQLPTVGSVDAIIIIDNDNKTFWVTDGYGFAFSKNMIKTTLNLDFHSWTNNQTKEYIQPLV